MTETDETMIKRLRMRSMRRGIKEMDLILQDFATRELDAMDRAMLDVYDAFLSENDHDLYQWVSGQGSCPDRYVVLAQQIGGGANGIVKPR